MNYTKTFQYKAVQYSTTNNYDLNDNNCWINPSLTVSPAAGDYNLPNCRICGRCDALDCIKSYKHTKTNMSHSLRPHTYSEGHRLPSITTFLLTSVGQHPLQQHLSQLFFPRMLSLNQSDGLSKRCPLTSDQPCVEFIQQSLLRSTQVLYLLPEGCAHSPPVLAAVTRNGALVAGVGTSKDPLVAAACPGDWGDSKCGKGWCVAEEGEAKSSHFMVNLGHLGGETRWRTAVRASCDF